MHHMPWGMLLQAGCDVLDTHIIVTCVILLVCDITQQAAQRLMQAASRDDRHAGSLLQPSPAPTPTTCAHHEPYSGKKGLTGPCCGCTYLVLTSLTL